MNNEIATIAERKGKAPIVRFVREAVEDKAASRSQGRYIARDVDFVHVTAPYSKDIFKQEAPDWFANMQREVDAGRLDPRWVDQWRSDYQRFQSGQEIPLRGTPIRGWTILSPAQQEMVIKVGILTVEDLAEVNDEGLRRIGMGGTELKNRAVTWLREAAGPGVLVAENAALKTEVATLKSSLADLGQKFEQLKADLVAFRGPRETLPVSPAIMADDILEDAPAPPPRRGRPPATAGV